MESIRSIYEDDPDMLEILVDFAKDLPQRVVELQEKQEQGDLASLQTLAHQLKGAGGGYGFQQITDVAGSLEQALKEGADASVIKDRCELLCGTLLAVEVSEST